MQQNRRIRLSSCCRTAALAGSTLWLGPPLQIVRPGYSPSVRAAAFRCFRLSRITGARRLSGIVVLSDYMLAVSARAEVTTSLCVTVCTRGVMVCSPHIGSIPGWPPPPSRDVSIGVKQAWDFVSAAVQALSTGFHAFTRLECMIYACNLPRVLCAIPAAARDVRSTLGRAHQSTTKKHCNPKAPPVAACKRAPRAVGVASGGTVGNNRKSANI